MDFLSPQEEHCWPGACKQWWLSNGLKLLMNNEKLCFPCFLSSSSNSHIKSCLQVGGERNWERALNEPERESAVVFSKLVLCVHIHMAKIQISPTKYSFWWQMSERERGRVREVEVKGERERVKVREVEVMGERERSHLHVLCQHRERERVWERDASWSMSQWGSWRKPVLKVSNYESNKRPGSGPA